MTRSFFVELALSPDQTRLARALAAAIDAADHAVHVARAAAEAEAVAEQAAAEAFRNAIDAGINWASLAYLQRQGQERDNDGWFRSIRVRSYDGRFARLGMPFEEAAAALGVTVADLYRARARGELTATRSDQGLYPVAFVPETALAEAVPQPDWFVHSLSIAQTADILGVTDSEVHKQIAAGALSSRRTIEGDLRVVPETDQKCLVMVCRVKSVDDGLCPKHLERWRITGDVHHGLRNVPCVVTGCDGVATSRGWCKFHYPRGNNYGDPGTVLPPQQRP